ncbi:MAG TPA: nicotinate-nucleotide adenylyltransferase [Candidatus Omnitrophota bacterium]|nr:nicotinate-nucleotide adenylyltransferase [Candidatus Omnitrophota bacterium]HPN88127.1 nicotinate-nucleotide adenylyltransferase [Candidatus Omnitrophota bacterium]
MKRIGILGGTFNPIHLGHLAIAQWAYEKLKLDKVIFVPSYFPPHKTTRGVVEAKHRFEMVKLAIEDNSYFEISDFEIQKKGKSYSIDTVRYFRHHFPKPTKFYFLIGEDAYKTLSTWRNIEELLGITQFVVMNRPGFQRNPSAIPVRFLTMLGIDVSSSYIRKCLASSKSVKYFLPEKVLRYIKEHQLYQS